jgi:hypothetical protein
MHFNYSGHSIENYIKTRRLVSGGINQAERESDKEDLFMLSLYGFRENKYKLIINFRK